MNKDNIIALKEVRRINKQKLIDKMTEYYYIVDCNKVAIFPLNKAIDIVEQWDRNGRLDTYGNLKIAK